MALGGDDIRTGVSRPKQQITPGGNRPASGILGLHLRRADEPLLPGTSLRSPLAVVEELLRGAVWLHRREVRLTVDSVPIDH